MIKRTDRRTFILLTGSAVTTSLAGCTGTDDDEANSDEAEAEAGEEVEEEEEDEAENGEGEEEDEDDDTVDAEYVDEVDGTVELSYGEEAETSFGVVHVAHGLDIQDSFERSSGREEEAEEGMQFALLNFEARNESDVEQRVALPTDPVLLHDGSQYDQQVGLPQRYEGGELQPGVTREGQLLYEVPEGITEDDLTTVLSKDSYDGDSEPYQFRVHWVG